MQPLSLADVVDQLGGLLSQPTEPNLRLVDAILWDALNQYDEQPHLWHYAAIHNNHLGRHALAAQCLKRCYDLESNPIVLANLGKTLRLQQQSSAALEVLTQALRRLPKDADTLGAIAACYVNEGNPLPGIQAGEESLILKADRGVMFNLGLLHLEAGNFARGFELYAEGEHRWRADRLYGGTSRGEPPVLTASLHDQLRGQGKRIVVYGEQGIGDEIMFSTMLSDVMEDYILIFDCHPRLESLHRSATWNHSNKAHFGQPIILPNRKDRREPNERAFGYDVDAKVAMGDLCRLYRSHLSDFTEAWEQFPMLRADMEETDGYEKLLRQTANGRKIVGLAMRGGTVSTATVSRRFDSKSIEALLSREDCLFVGLDYEDMTQTAEWAKEKFGPKRYIWNTAINFAWDYSHVAALVEATDIVISVPQSVAHLSSAMGHRTVILNPVKTAWRECDPTKDCPIGRNEPEPWYWYGKHATMLRQQLDGDWTDPLMETHKILDSLQVRA